MGSLNRAEGELVESTIDALAGSAGELAEVGNEPTREQAQRHRR